MTKTQEINSLLIELHYFPCVSYFKLLSKYEKVFLEAEEHFIKQTYRNRTYILTSNKIDRLSIPVIHQDKKKPIKFLRIDYKQKWQLRHWRAIKSAYAKAPFFEYYADFFEKEIFANYETLWELNWNILSVCLRILDMPVILRQTDRYYKTEIAGNYFKSDLRNQLLPDLDTGIIHVKPYNQLFSSTFIKNLAILDLLFNEGPLSKQIILDSSVDFKTQNN